MNRAYIISKSDRCLSLKTASEMASYVNSFYGPRFNTLRWVPLRYRRILPLEVMKRYQCIVVGATQGELTVAFASRQNKSVIGALMKMTGYTIFPVLVAPARIRLLIHRIESYERHRRSLNWPYYVHWFQMHSMLEYILSKAELRK
jgi:Type II secretion system (T2SS), protein E, N-terminal domain